MAQGTKRGAPSTTATKSSTASAYSNGKANGAAGGNAANGTGTTGRQNSGGGKKTKGRVKIKMEFIDNKLRRYTTFSKRKTGIMKKVSGLWWLHFLLASFLLLAGEFSGIYSCRAELLAILRQKWLKFVG